MSRVFFVSIARSFELREQSIDTLYAGLGQNTGNLLFTNAVWRQVAYTESGSGFVFNPDRINEQFDVVVIPAANWLYQGFDFTDLAERIEQLRVPVVLIGIGAQAGTDMAIPTLPDGTLRFLRAVSERSALIGTRGEFSSHVLDSYGIHNHKPIGCPSLFLRYRPDSVIEKRPLRRVMIGGTRYGVPNVRLNPVETFHRRFYELAANEAFDINFQSERPEIDVLLASSQNMEATQLPPALVSYYGLKSGEELRTFLQAHGRVYLNVDTWVEDMRDYDLYVGTRIHGAIAALLAGTPALLVVHDSRTKELGDFAAMPQTDLWDQEIDEVAWIDAMYSRLDFGAFERQMAVNNDSYAEFLSANGLSHRVQRVSVPS